MSLATTSIARGGVGAAYHPGRPAAFDLCRVCPSRYSGVIVRAVLTSLLCLVPPAGARYAAYPEVRYGAPPDLPRLSVEFLADGQTTRDEAQRHIGLPWATFQDGRIWVYRFDGSPDAGFARADPGRYHLILVFDADGRLRRRGLVNVRP